MLVCRVNFYKKIPNCKCIVKYKAVRWCTQIAEEEKSSKAIKPRYTGYLNDYCTDAHILIQLQLF